MFALPQTRHHLKVNERLGLQAVLGEGIPSQARPDPDCKQEDMPMSSLLAKRGLPLGLLSKLELMPGQYESL